MDSQLSERGLNKTVSKSSEAKAQRSERIGAAQKPERIGKPESPDKPEKIDEKVVAFAKRHVRGLLAVIVMVLLVHDVFGTHGFIAMQRTAREIKKVQADLD